MLNSLSSFINFGIGFFGVNFIVYKYFTRGALKKIDKFPIKYPKFAFKQWKKRSFQIICLVDSNFQISEGIINSEEKNFQVECSSFSVILKKEKDIEIVNKDLLIENYKLFSEIHRIKFSNFKLDNEYRKIERAINQLDSFCKLQNPLFRAEISFIHPSCIILKLKEFPFKNSFSVKSRIFNDNLTGEIEFSILGNKKILTIMLCKANNKKPFIMITSPKNEFYIRNLSFELLKILKEIFIDTNIQIFNNCIISNEDLKNLIENGQLIEVLFIDSNFNLFTASSLHYQDNLEFWTRKGNKVSKIANAINNYYREY